MLKDITLGQYFPIDSPIHALDSRIKIISTIIFIISIFIADNVAGYALSALFILAVILISKVDFRIVIKSIKPIMFLVIFTSVINALMTSGVVIWSFGILKITKEGIYMAITMSVRLILLVIGTSMLTFTTSPIFLTDGIEKLLSPFSKIGVPAHEFAMMMSIAIRFIPILLEEVDKITKAQMARGADFESGNIIRRIKALIPILVPLFISSFRRADELAMAMECRCYRGGEGRTRLRELKICKRDYVALFIVLGFLLAIIFLKIYF